MPPEQPDAPQLEKTPPLADGQIEHGEPDASPHRFDLSVVNIH
jgi:hypothetical protein